MLKTRRKKTCQHRKHRWRIDTTARRLHRKTWRTNYSHQKRYGQHDRRRTPTTRKQKWEEKQLYGSFKRLVNNISHQKTWTWLRKGNLKREKESLRIAAQDNAMRTIHINARIDKTQQNSKCRLCSNRDEMINHLINVCSKLAQKEYKALWSTGKCAGNFSSTIQTNGIYTT